MSAASNDTFKGSTPNDVIFTPTYPAASNSRMLFGPPSACNGGDPYPVLTLEDHMATVSGVVASAAVNTNLVHSTGIHLSTYDPTASNVLEVVAPMYMSPQQQFTQVFDSNLQSVAYWFDKSLVPAQDGTLQIGSPQRRLESVHAASVSTSNLVTSTGMRVNGRVAEFNVRMFGAAGDGTTDDTQAMVRAVAAINALPSFAPARLYFPMGSYVLKQPIVLRDRPVAVVGDGPSVTQITWASDASFTGVPGAIYLQPCSLSTATSAQIEATYGNNFMYVAGITCKNDRSPLPSPSNVDCVHIDMNNLVKSNEILPRLKERFIVEKMSMSGFWRNGVFSNQAHYCVVSDVTFLGNVSTAAVNLQTTGFGAVVHVIRVWAKSATYGIFISGDMEGVRVEACDFIAVFHGVHVVNTQNHLGVNPNPAYYAPQFVLTRTHVSAGTRCVYLAKYTQSTIIDNLFYVKDQGVWLEDCVNTTVKNNIFGLHNTTVRTINTVKGSGILYEGNLIDGPNGGDASIWLDGGSNASTNVTCLNNWTNGLNECVRYTSNATPATRALVVQNVTPTNLTSMGRSLNFAGTAAMSNRPFFEVRDGNLLLTQRQSDTSRQSWTMAIDSNQALNIMKAEGSLDPRSNAVAIHANRLAIEAGGGFQPAVIQAHRADGNTSAAFNVGIASWFGIGFTSLYDNTTRCVYDTRTGNMTMDGSLTAGGTVLRSGGTNLLRNTAGSLSVASELELQLLADYNNNNGGSTIVFGSGNSNAGLSNYTENMRIHCGSGHIGIGASNAISERLHVIGKIRSESQFLNASGNNSNVPCYSFAGDSNTGMYSAGGDELGIVTGGAERMRVNAAGNIGIGTTAPTSRLHVDGTIRAGRAGATAPAVQLGDSSASGGNLFISALDSTMAAGTQREILFGQSNAPRNTGRLSYFHTGNFSSSNRVIVGFQEAEVMHLTAGGRVGIMTAAPSSSLHVVGTARISDDTIFEKNVNIQGTASINFVAKTGGSFDIVHPDPAKAANGYRLRHCFVEAPTRGDNMYTYKFTTTTPNQAFEVALPDYFPHLNENPRAIVSCEEDGVLSRCCARVTPDLTAVRGMAEAPGTYTILVIGTRKDQAMREYFDDNGGAQYVRSA
jgi:hypothetical protein